MKKYFENEEYSDEIEPIIKDLKKTVYASGIYLLKQSLKNEIGLSEVMGRIQLMEDNIKGNNPISIVDSFIGSAGM